MRNIAVPTTIAPAPPAKKIGWWTARALELGIMVEKKSDRNPTEIVINATVISAIVSVLLFVATLVGALWKFTASTYYEKGASDEKQKQLQRRLDELQHQIDRQPPTPEPTPTARK